MRLPKAPAAGRPTWHSSGLMIPSGGDVAEDRSGQRARAEVLRQHGRRGVGPEHGLARPRRLEPHLHRRRTSRAGRQGVRRGTLPALRALPREPAHEQGPELLAKNVGPATFSPDGKQLAFVARNTKLELWTLATRSSRSLSLGGNVRDCRSGSGVAAMSSSRSRKTRASVIRMRTFALLLDRGVWRSWLSQPLDRPARRPRIRAAISRSGSSSRARPSRSTPERTRGVARSGSSSCPITRAARACSRSGTSR